MDFDVWSDVLVAQSQVQSQIVADLEIVLPEEALTDTPLSPADRKRFADIVGKAEQKIRHAGARIVHADLLRVRTVEIESSEDAVVGPVEAILAIAQDFGPHFEDVASTR